MTFLRNTGITLTLFWGVASGFSSSSTINHISTSVSTSLFSSNLDEVTPTRRGFLETSVLSTVGILTSLSTQSQPAFADEEQSSASDEDVKTVQTPLYYVVRVREATDQESRLIKSGKFKDVQRANVKLAVKFMVENYRLNDNFIAASAYLSGTKRIQAVDIGQSTVQNLFTILEYFDSSDVQNIKVGSNSMSGKEALVLKGLEATKKGIDEFLSFFPKEDVEAVVQKIEKENELNFKEFDPQLGDILNPKPIKS